MAAKVQAQRSALHQGLGLGDRTASRGKPMSNEKILQEKTCDIIKRFIELLSEVQPSLSETLALDIERQLRHEYAGERVYIPKRDKSVHVQIAARFTGNNTEKLVRELRVSRRTVYRALKKSRCQP